MRIPLKWLSEYVDITLPAGELAHRLTLAGLESLVETSGHNWDKVSVAHVVEVNPHPNADRLRLATVDLGEGERMTVVCGAPNVAAGQKVAFARQGAKLIDGHSGQPMELMPAVIRGVESAGMVCSERELGLSDQHEGILVLSEDAPIGMLLAQYMGDVILETEVTANRGDLLSVLGTAREVAALTNNEVHEPLDTYWEDGTAVSELASVAIVDSDLCFRYCASLIEGIKVGPSPQWLQEKLSASGSRPINNVVDVTNYVMLELGQPLHAFDLNLVGDRKIVVRRAHSDEKLVTLDSVERSLNADMLVIADSSKAMALAGIIGGAPTQVTQKTSSILIESATFNPVNIRRTSSSLGLRTEASIRFEKGLSQELAMVAVKRATKLLLGLTGGRAAKGIIDVYPNKARVHRIMVSRERLQRVLGVDLPPTKVRQTLTALGYGCRWVSSAHYVVRVPYWRTDVSIPDDIAEELGRIIGYDQLPSTSLTGPIPSIQPQPDRELRGMVQDALVAAGLQEVINYSLVDMEKLSKVVDPEELSWRPPVRVANPMSKNQDQLRPTLRVSLLDSLATNRRYGRETMAIFEAGRVYLAQEGDLPHEVEMVAGLVSGRRLDRWGQPHGEPLSFEDTKGYVEHVLARLGLQETYEAAEEYALVPGRTAVVSVASERIGVLGQLHPEVTGAWDIGQEVYLFEISLEALLPHIGGVRLYRPILRFPSVIEDIAVVVSEDTPAGKVKAAIESFPLVRTATLFDIYTGQPIPPGKKSLAYSVSYQADDHTLTDGEVERERNRIIERLRKELSAELRQ